nr:basic proline-rich protein-like [Symphalangus syndactylus]
MGNEIHTMAPKHFELFRNSDHTNLEHQNRSAAAPVPVRLQSELERMAPPASRGAEGAPAPKTGRPGFAVTAESPIPAASPSWSAGPSPWTETPGAAAPGGRDRLLPDPRLELRARRGRAERLSAERNTRHLSGRTPGRTRAGRAAVGARGPPLPNALSLRARPPPSPPFAPAPPPAPPLLGIEHQNARLQGPLLAGSQESPPRPPSLSGCLRLLPARLPRAIQKLAPPAEGARQCCPWPSPGAYLGRRTGWTEARLRVGRFASAGRFATAASP